LKVELFKNSNKAELKTIKGRRGKAEGKTSNITKGRRKG